MASLQPDAADGGDLSDQTLATMKSEYPEFDAEEVMETICGLPAIGFNADFLRDGIESAEGDEMRLRLIDPLRPGLIQGPGEDFWYLIMPIRLAG